MNHGVYVEHAKRTMIEGLAFDYGCDHTVTKCSGQWYMFTTEDQAITFIWRLRNLVTRYVEIDAALEPALKAFVIKQGFSGDLTGLISKILKPVKETKVKKK